MDVVVSERLRRLAPPVEAAAADGAFAGAVVHVRHRGRVLWHAAHGLAQMVPERRPMRPDLVFDLASLTKPMATATAALQLWERGDLDIDRPVAAYLPAFGRHGKDRVTVRQLLTHTSGLPAWIRLYLHARTPAEAIARICALEPEYEPGTRVVYSDPGFITLGHLVGSIGGLTLNEYLRAHVAPALGWERTRFRPPRDWEFAATEVGNGYEREAAGGEGEGFAWRTDVIVGEAHDGNSFYLFDGEAGHAGLFGTAEEVGRFAQAMLDGGRGPHGRVLRPETVAEATRDQTPGLDESRGLGWWVGQGVMATRSSPRAFAHAGFTGTSIHADPEQDLMIVLLANRVHPRADAAAFDRFRAFRGRFHDAVIEAVGERWSG